MTGRLLRLLLLWVAAGSLPAQTTNAPAASLTNATTATNAPAANPFPEAIPPASIIGQSQALLAQYPASLGTPAVDPVQTDVQHKLAEMGPELQIFSQETDRLLAANPSLDRIRFFMSLGRNFASYPASWTDTITHRTAELSDKLAQIAKDKKPWTDTQKALAGTTPPPPVDLTHRVTQVLSRLDATAKNATTCQTNLLTLEVLVTQQSTTLTDSLTKLRAARDRAISQLFEQNAPPLWTGLTTPNAPEEQPLTWERQVQTLHNYAAAQSQRFIVHAGLFALLTMFFYWLRRYGRRRSAEEPEIKEAAGIFETPLATAGLLALVASPILYYPIAPRLLSVILGASALVPSVILLRRLIEPRLYPTVAALAVFFSLEEIRSLAVFPEGYGRVFLLVEVLGALAFLGWLLNRLRRATQLHRFGRTVKLGARTAFLLLVIAALANLFGYVLLSALICETVQRSATLALVLYACIRIVGALLFILSRLRPLSELGMVRLHRPLLLTVIGRGLIWIAVVTWLYYTLELLSLSGPLFGYVFNFLGAYNPSTHQTTLLLPGKILLAVVLCWGVYQLSKFARFTLETDFYPRLHLSAGIPYAISSTLHYAMLVVAFIGATYVLGINLTSFTILVSALGVGVGFGLQNIINNFVSGLILLFERPVKIGDSVQVGDAVGVVERIGIRASTLRTTSGSELIVPNGSLISNNVINWTLSTQERIIVIPLNVARGPDIARLLELLKSTAAAHPKVTAEPPPQVLVLALGANLSFELRAWTRDMDWNMVRSDLMLSLNTALAKENIVLA